MFSVVFSKSSASEFKKLPSDLKERIKQKLRDSEDNPYHFFERLKGRLDYKLRVGDYRIIADIYENTISITKIGHRKNIYKKL